MSVVRFRDRDEARAWVAFVVGCDAALSRAIETADEALLAYRERAAELVGAGPVASDMAEAST